MNLESFLQGAVASVVFTALGVVMLWLAFTVLNRVLPFSLRKEIEEDQNIALGIVLGAIILGIAIIVAAAIHG